MDRHIASFGDIDITGLAVRVERALHAAALRYFDAAAFDARVHQALGTGLPTTLQALRMPAAAAAGEVMLAWRSPTETLLLSAGADPIVALQTELAGATDGCIVDQTGGVAILRVSGARTLDLMARLGASTAMPKMGEALTSRLADLTVLALRVQEPQIILVVDRVYADHLIGWISATVEDF
jgi:heterotetrameric sarcosine oxidase gamma subunit